MFILGFRNTKVKIWDGDVSETHGEASVIGAGWFDFEGKSAIWVKKRSEGQNGSLLINHESKGGAVSSIMKFLIYFSLYIITFSSLSRFFIPTNLVKTYLRYEDDEELELDELLE